MPSGCAVPAGNVANCVACRRFHADAGSANDASSAVQSTRAKRVTIMTSSPWMLGRAAGCEHRTTAGRSLSAAGRQLSIAGRRRLRRPVPHEDGCDIRMGFDAQQRLEEGRTMALEVLPGSRPPGYDRCQQVQRAEVVAAQVRAGSEDIGKHFPMPMQARARSGANALLHLGSSSAFSHQRSGKSRMLIAA